jgi:hypothetical protein
VILRLVSAVLLLVVKFLLSLIGAQRVGLVPPTCVVVRRCLGLSRAELVDVAALHGVVVLVVMEVPGLVTHLVGYVLHVRSGVVVGHVNPSVVLVHLHLLVAVLLTMLVYVFVHATTGIEAKRAVAIRVLIDI